MKIEYNLDLTGYNSYRLHSIAAKAYFPENIEDFKTIIALPNLAIIGGGCNVILSKKIYDKENFVFIKENYSGITNLGEGNLIVKAGTDLKDLSTYACENSLSGMEYYYDIPGCVGGATIMNAGCQGVSFSDFISTILYYDVEDNRIVEINKEDAKYKYRGNILSKRKVIILEVKLKLRVGNKEDIWRTMISNKEKRWQKQPRNFPSAGSVFKRPEGHYVGPMITDVGLKGFRIGGAMISDVHAGFIVNVDNANSDDILSLIELAKTRVKEKFDVDLELEQRII